MISFVTLCMQLISTLPTDHVNYTFDATLENESNIVRQAWVAVRGRRRRNQLSQVGHGRIPKPVAAPTPSLLSTLRLGLFPGC